MTQSQLSTYVESRVDARGVAYVTLNRPEKHNAFDDTMIAALHQCFSDFGARSEIRALVMEARGASFSAGADLEWMRRVASYSYDDNLRDAKALARMLNALRTLPQPTIARVQGNAFGGAVGLISCCDIAIASAGARFGLTEARIGLIPATIGPYVIEAIGRRWASRLFLTAEHFDATLAERIQLVHSVCAELSLDDRVNAQIEQLLRNSPQAMGAAKTLLREVAGRAIDAQLIDDTSARIAQIRVSEEGQEGLRAFLEKRDANWIDGSTG